jgi:hypothetical protein
MMMMMIIIIIIIIIIDKSLDFSRPDLVLIDRENQTALVIDIAVALNHDLR